jgi:hypothetical protein
MQMGIPNYSSLTDINKLKILAAVFFILFGSGVYIGNHTVKETPALNDNDKILQGQEISYQDLVKKDVKDTNADIQFIKEAKGNVSTGRFRINCQDVEGGINSKWVNAKNDINYEHKNINKLYIAYLVAASEVIQEYEKGNIPDTSKMEKLGNEILSY